MDIRGVMKLSLLDYPEKVACTVFTGGCNLRCPFCHNPSLVLPERLRAEPPSTTADDFFAFLRKRRGVLDGVCITGGEPLMQPDLEAFIGQIRALGYLVKLDTNGTFPDRLERLLASGAIDYVAMDVKNALERYPETVGIPGFSTDGVARSIQLLRKGQVPYEFRTTVMRELHRREDLVALARTIAGARAYVLQQFVDSGALIAAAPLPAASSATVAEDAVPTRAETLSYMKLTGYAAGEMAALAEAVRPWVPSVTVRGV